MNISRIKFHLDKSGFTVRDFCRMVGITNPTYYKALRDNDILASNLEKMCKILKVSPMEFFDNSGYTLQDSLVEEVKEDAVSYSKKKDIHMGKAIEDRLDAIGMSVAEFGRRIGTTRQNAQNLLKRKHITIENLIQYNEVLNPPSSTPWDLFEMFLRKKPETIQDKYTHLLEEHNTLLRTTSNKKPRKL